MTDDTVPVEKLLPRGLRVFLTPPCSRAAGEKRNLLDRRPKLLQEPLAFGASPYA
jgi:hypothetical protein